MTALLTAVTRAFVIVFAVATLALVGCGGGDTGGSGGAATVGGGSSANGSASIKQGSPEEVFASLLDAITKNDMASLPRLYQPETQREMAQGMIAMAATAGMNPMVDGAAIDAVLKKHGVDKANLPKLGPNMEAESAALLDKLEDVGAFAGDMLGTVADSTAMGQALPNTVWQAYKQGMKLENLNIDGDSATADVHVPGGDDNDRSLRFVRVDGKWYLGE